MAWMLKKKWAARLAALTLAWAAGVAAAATGVAAAPGMRQPLALGAAALDPVDVANQLLDFGQRQFPKLFPGAPATQFLDVWIYRFYASTGIYLGVRRDSADPGGVYVLGGEFGTAPQRVGTLTDFITPVATGSIAPTSGRISAGFYHTLAVNRAGDVLAWGWDSTIAAPGTALAGSTARRLGGLPAAAAVEAGASVLATGTARTSGGAVWAWEALAPAPKWQSALGNAVKAAHCDGTLGNIFALGADGLIRTRDGAVLAGIDSVVDVSEDSFIGGGTCTLMALKSNGTLWRLAVLSSGGAVISASVLQVAGLPAVAQASCSQDGNFGQLCLAVDSGGHVYAWGSSNSHGQFGNGTQDSAGRVLPALVPGLANIVRVLAGDGLALALARDGTLYRWGFQPFDQPKLTPTAVTGLPARVVEMSASFNHVVVLLEDGSVWGWGDNFQGQLGDGTQGNSRLTPVRALGIQLD